MSISVDTVTPNVTVGVVNPNVTIEIDNPIVEISSNTNTLEVQSTNAVVNVTTVGDTPARVISFPVPSKTWVVENKRLAHVVVIDSANTVVEPGTITYDGTNMILEFSAAFSGTAILVD